MTNNIEQELKIGYSESQKNRFKKLCEKAQKKEFSLNQAYEYAQIDGEEGEQGFKGSFKEWVVNAQENEWIDKPINKTVQEIVQKKEVLETKKPNYIVPVLIGVGVAIVLIYAIKKHGGKN